jgi:ribosomal protein RSM22 (predicted rRNA methylase)
MSTGPRSAGFLGWDKNLLHNDAKRLFHGKLDEGDEWDSKYSQKYRSRVQAARHGERDGTAFASIALPYHYSAVFSVLNHTKQRLGPSWQVSKVLDWGSATGSGLWYGPLLFANILAIMVS